ncbi:hypothetical protein APA_5101 [Pseudanabaena sp. lw0831]|nr:hypothetical protein APA_5101 [Pseudanabaena sp. lw0831]
MSLSQDVLCRKATYKEPFFVARLRRATKNDSLLNLIDVIPLAWVISIIGMTA